jgi:hypothetical protein
MECIQDRQFLRTGVLPTVGQRVELRMNLNPEFASSGRKDKTMLHCDFSRQVTGVNKEGKWFPKSHKDDTKGSMFLSVYLGSKKFRTNMSAISSTVGKSLLTNSTFSPCPCGEKECFDGELFLPQQDWEELQDNVKLDLSIPLLMLGGVKPGQEVVCEGRLNFDYDSTYGTRLHLLRVASYEYLLVVIISTYIYFFLLF